MRAMGVARWKEPVRDGQGKVAGYRVMTCPVEIVLDEAFALKKLGGTACRSKSGKSVDGPCTVKRAGPPKVESQELEGVHSPDTCPCPICDAIRRTV